MNNWTPDRPTKPGKYWLSVHPDKRPEEQRPDVMFPHAIACEVTQVVEWMLGEQNANALDHEQRRFVWAVKYLSGGAWLRLSDFWFDGALWRPCVEPPDPFAEPVPSLRERVEVLERYGAWTPDSGGAVVLAEKEGAYLLRSEVLALLDEVTR